MIIKMAIADRNVEYVERMINVLEGYEEIKLSVYTEKAALEQALASRSFDVLLFDASLYDGQEETKHAALTVMLSNDTEEIPEGCRSFHRISKYQRISKIYQQVLELYAEVCSDAGLLNSQARTAFIAFYSPAGGTGKTSLALAAAMRLAARGYKTFYLNLEDIPSEDFFLAQEGERGLSDLVSCMGENINFTLKVQSLLQNKTENMYYLNHFNSPNDVYEMTEEELEKLIEELGKTRLFQAIVMDMGVALDRKAMKVFEAADKIVLVEKADAPASRKLSHFLTQAHIMNEHGDKMLRVLNFDTGRGSSLSTNIPLIGRINAVQNPDATQFVTMLANDARGSYVLQLMK